MDASVERMLILRPTLALGGVETRLATLAERLHDAGGVATVLAGDGPLAARVTACARLQRVDWPRLSDSELRQLVATAAGGHTCAVMACEPLLLRAVAPLAEHVPVLLGLHGRGDRNRMGFGLLGGRRLPRLIAALVASGRVVLTGTSPVQARDNARVLGLPDDAVHVSPNCVTAPPAPATVSAGEVATVALVCRLAPEKLHNVRAAIALVAAGRAAGRPVVLDVFGRGSATRLVRRLLARGLPDGAWRLRGEVGDPFSAVAHADVVVGTGRAAVEALVMGRRVVVAKALHDPAGQLGALITPATFDAAADENFGWRSHPALAPQDVWRALDSVCEADVAAVRDRAHEELSAPRMLARELELLATLAPAPAPAPAASGALAEAASLASARWGRRAATAAPAGLPRPRGAAPARPRQAGLVSDARVVRGWHASRRVCRACAGFAGARVDAGVCRARRFAGGARPCGVCRACAGQAVTAQVPCEPSEPALSDTMRTPKPKRPDLPAPAASPWPGSNSAFETMSPVGSAS
jgi:hypothetical protein